MGYNGKLDKNKRTRFAVIEEANRLIQTGLDMFDALSEVEESFENPFLSHITLKIGIHTGRVVAGLIGTRLVKYDVFGEGVLITYKTCKSAPEGSLLISEETMRTICEEEEIRKHYVIDQANQISVVQIGQLLNLFKVSGKNIE